MAGRGISEDDIQFVLDNPDMTLPGNDDHTRVLEAKVPRAGSSNQRVRIVVTVRTDSQGRVTVVTVMIRN